MSQDLHSDLTMSPGDAARDIAAHPIFSLPAILAGYALLAVIFFGLVFSAAAHRTALIQPIDPNFHALMIGLGVFIGILLAVIAAVGRLAGIGGGRTSPLVAVTLIPLLITGLCGYAGSYAAERIVEWQAFRGITPQTVDKDFIVTSRRHGKSGASLKLQLAGSPYEIALSCSWGIYAAVATGDHLVLPVEIGRNGIERTQLPASASELRHG